MPRKQVVVLVDDDATFRDMLRAALVEVATDPVEMLVYPVGSAGEARLYLGSIKPDLVIVDLKLPDGDGVELCRALRHDPVLRRVPILVLSGLAPVAEVRDRALAAGADRFLAKPFDLDAFADEVQALLPAKGEEGRASGQ